MYKRLDNELVKRGFFISRSKARQAIKSGIVFCDGQLCIKMSKKVYEHTKIEIQGEVLPYVSRGGLKLAEAISAFKIDLNNKVMLDIGSSTGGFTDCALQNGIKEVIAVDVGSNQMVEDIKNNRQVYLFEKTDIRNFQNDLLNKVDIITIDVSFISVTKIIDKIKEIANAQEIICLIKPQFECGKEVADQYKGIIMNKKVHTEVINKVVVAFQTIDFALNSLVCSPIKGGSGNTEYLAYFTHQQSGKINIDNIVNNAFKK